MRTAIFSARFDQLDAIREFAAQAARDAGMDDSAIYAIELSMDEACTNIIEHAYEGQEGGEIECTCDSGDKLLTIILHDHGKSFDPSSIALPNLEAALDSRPVGGLGVFLMNKLMDEVHFESLGEAGNVLTMVKGRKPGLDKARVARRLTRWKQILVVGEEILKADSLTAQRDLILEASTRLLECQADLWLDERLFRLPGSKPPGLFTSMPPSGTMMQAFLSGVATSSDGPATILSIPLKNNNMVMGVLQVEKPAAPFRKKEIELLDGLAGHVSLALMASHRFAVEKWRIEQLTLVRRVSAQIANVFDLEELTRRVTRLIQRTFHYYYVAIFTREGGQHSLKFHSSAGPDPGRRGRRVKARLGEGLVGSVALTGEEAVALDVRSDHRFKFLEALPQTKSEAVLPLKIEDNILGVLDVQSDQLDAFHPNDLMVLRALADTIAIAINGARLYSDLQRQIGHLAMVSEVSKDVTATLDLKELLAKVADLIQKRLNIPYVHLYTVHLNRRQIIFEAGSGGRSRSLKDIVVDLDSDRGIIPWVARNKKTMVVNDVRREPLYEPSPVAPADTNAEMTLPLVYNDEVVGVLDLQSDHFNAFSEETRLLCDALADNVSAAVHNADLYSTERWRRQVADSLQEVAGLISAEVGLEEVLDRILRELERNLPCDVSAIWLMDGERLYLAQAHGGDVVEIDTAAQRWPEAYGFLAAALTADQPIIRKPDDPIGPTGTALGYAADYSSIAAGLRAGDRPLGVLTLSHHTSGRYGHEAQAMTSTFASYAAVAIENARLYDSAQEQAYASAALLQVAQAVASANNLDETISSIVRITPILVGVEACAIYSLEANRFHPTHSYGFTEAAEAVLLNREFGSGDFPLLDLVQENSQMVVGLLPPGISDNWLDLELTQTEQETIYALQNGDHLLIGFPLMIKNDLFGVILVEETSEDIRFRQKRVEIINSIAQQVALSIQNDRLQREMVTQERLEHEMLLARQIQKTFLPEHLPEVDGWSLAATWITARQVGGDFYDVIELPAGRLGLFIADVSDKGIPAALFMALTQTLVRAVVFDATSPADALRRVNSMILPNNQQSMFVTAVFGVLRLETGEFIYANAGHNPPLRIRREKKMIERLERTGAALGIFEDLPMEDRTITLETDDFLLLYTDGLTEAFSANDETYGEERLHQVLKTTRAVTSRGVLDALETSARKFMGVLPPADDLTMLGIRRES
jgi:serine phosphatase RsbU (regulator of sigma subunit)/putative methionine-R-sulfoxide reductase with GAF domain/anti-sigma regulatory factor (Ser/Thr protein kinase)